KTAPRTNSAPPPSKCFAAARSPSALRIHWTTKPRLTPSGGLIDDSPVPRRGPSNSPDDVAGLLEAIPAHHDDVERERKPGKGLADAYDNLSSIRNLTLEHEEIYVTVPVHPARSGRAEENDAVGPAHGEDAPHDFSDNRVVGPAIAVGYFRTLVDHPMASDSKHRNGFLLIVLWVSACGDLLGSTSPGPACQGSLTG